MFWQRSDDFSKIRKNDLKFIVYTLGAKNVSKNRFRSKNHRTDLPKVSLESEKLVEVVDMIKNRF